MKITELLTYPFKGCRAWPSSTVMLTQAGFEGDRRFMTVTSEGGHFISQQSQPKLSRVAVSCHDPNQVWLIAHGEPPLKLLLGRLQEGSELEVEVYGQKFLANHQGHEASEWMTKFLGIHCKVVAVTKDNPRLRQVDGFSPMHLNCHDSSPVHLISRASLQALNEALTSEGHAPISAERFRPNIIVDGQEPWQEESGERISGFSRSRMIVRKKTVRCSTINVDSTTGERSKVVRNTLAKLRGISERDVTFGIYLVPIREGRLTVGEKLLFE